MISTDCIGSDPTSRAWHTHRRCIGQPVAATEMQVLVGLGLQSPGTFNATAVTMVLGKALVPIEEVDVSFRGQLAITTDTRNPHQHLRCQEVETQTRDRAFFSF
jgi:hypothetical protein